MKFPLILAAFVPLTTALTNVIGDVKVDVDVQTNDILSNSVKATNDRNQNEPVDLPPRPQKQPVETKPQLPTQTKGFELPTKFPFYTFPWPAFGLQPQNQPAKFQPEPKEPFPDFPLAALGFPGVHPKSNYNFLKYHSNQDYTNHYNNFEYVENVNF